MTIGQAPGVTEVETGRPFVMSVSEFSHTPLAALQQAEDGTLRPYMPEYFGRKAQELPSAYRPNGAIHVVDVQAFKRARSYLADPLVGYVMPRERSIDIDTLEDLRMAEAQLAEADLRDRRAHALALV
jgi:CMP-N-acetylneuraminic acid synthetase